ncbi:glycosyltransferase [Neiella marina]|uniref:Glycosyltransferase n=1 Tax=Neiella holothuriorum TaxID=2870530 RepID=A0ABS7EE78_9GAMM|nr:glycosyltransferase [Neiella holothuriorum]MBW8190550.1 glycosyltransferase [Neiella holothuriorum]
MKSSRVLHIINRLNTGGVERWLLGVAEGLQDSEIQVDVLVHTEEPSEFDDAFTATGSKIVKCRYQRDPFRYAWRLYKTLKQNPYDAIHSHVDHFSGLVLMVAFLAGVKLRICHSHSNRENIEPKKGLRQWYLRLMKWLIYIFCNKYLSVSKEAERSLYGAVVPPQKLEVFYCGLKHLNEITVNPQLKSELQLPENSLIVGHVGRLSEPKNHRFILQIFARLVQRVDATLVLVGDGELRADIEQQIAQLNLQSHVKILGMRADAVDIMASVFDVMLFPSLYEGLPLTVVEAQVAGVPILVADNITKEAGFSKHMVAYASLNDSEDQWCDALLALKSTFDRNEREDSFKQTDFYMPNHIQKLQQLYMGV